jgi:CARDB
MKLLALAGAFVLGLCATVASADPPPRAALRNFVCQRALDPPARAVSVKAVMRPLPATTKLSLRFQLLMTRRSLARASLVHAGDLGAWITPKDATLGRQAGDIWALTKPVVNLVAPATYRFRVTFRWTGPTGRPLGTAVLLSPLCFQPELRPDLLVRSISVRSIGGQPSQDRYIATIRNAGATAAGPFQVAFAAPGGGSASATTRTVARLAAHSGLQETFVGPLCTTGAPTITVDPAGQVDDFDRSNNSLTATCPGSGG